MRMTLPEILELISEIDEKDISKSLMQELVLRSFKEGMKEQKKKDKKDNVLNSSLGYSRIGRDAMRRG